MSYINTTTKQYPISEADIRAAFPNTSFTVPFKAPDEYEVVFITPQPTVDNPVLQFVREVAPELTNKGVWEQRWEVTDRYQEYTDSDGEVVTKEEQETNAVLQDNELKKQANKLQAERLLLETDWVENPSVSNTSLIPHLDNIGQFMEYRLALRAIAVNPPVLVQPWPQAPVKIWITE